MTAMPVPGRPEAPRPVATRADVTEMLDALAVYGVVSFHHQRVKRTWVRINHLVVTPSGIYVVETRMWTGRVELREPVNLRRHERLMVGGRDRTRLAESVARKASVVQRALDGFVVPVQAVLCYIDGDWPVWARPIEVRAATVMWPRELERRAKQLGRQQRNVDVIAARLDHALS